ASCSSGVSRRSSGDAESSGTGDTTGGGDGVGATGDSGTTDTGGGDSGSDDGGTTGGGPLCVPDELSCKDDNTSQQCAITGGEWIELPCTSIEKCFEGQCSPISCTPGQKLQECAGPTAFLMCNPVGTHYLPTQCKGGLFCYEGDCVDFECEPDSVTCQGFGAVRRCKSDGSEWEVIEQCEKGGTCFSGECISACDVNLKAATYSGCEYFAVDLDNIEGGQFEPVAIVVSVPSSVENSTVAITENATGHSYTAAELNAISLTVASGTLAVFELPLGGDIDGSIKALSSYRITTTSPATVHQFNPLNGSEVFTNDASLLLPSQAGGTEYFIMSWAMRSDEFETLRGFATVIATQPGDTEVIVTPRSDTFAGEATMGVSAILSGETVSFILQQGEVLNLETAGEEGADLSGTRVLSDQRVSVFGGHECANVPIGINACDHLEQQLVPVAAWGKRYISDAFKPRSPDQFDIYRVMAGSTDVLVETNPPIAGYEKFLLQPGGYVTFQTSKHFEVKASGRIQVGHYMIGSSYPGHLQTCKKSGIGDPAFTMAVPTQQFLAEYTVLTPPGYAENYINIMAPAGADVLVDGLPLPPTSPLKQVAPGLDWGVAQHPVTTGVHTITAKKKIGLTAYGYDCDVSYAYPGGLRLLSLDLSK
ncbi:MAG: hypothetical protein ACI9WU_002609, partial [Myxococcota bacterium]